MNKRPMVRTNEQFQLVMMVGHLPLRLYSEGGQGGIESK